MTVAKIYFEDGFVVPMHSHHNEQITQVVKGKCVSNLVVTARTSAQSGCYV